MTVDVYIQMTEDNLLPQDHSVPEATAAVDRPAYLTAAYEEIAEAAHQQFQADIVTLFPIDPVSGAFLHTSPIVYGTLLHEEHSSFEFPRPAGVAHQALQDGLVVIPDIHADPQYTSTFCSREQVNAFLAVRLQSPGRTNPFAILYVDYRQPRAFTDAEGREVANFAAEAAKKLQAIWLRERYHKLINIGQAISQEIETLPDLLRRLDFHLRTILDLNDLIISVYDETSLTLDVYQQDANGTVSDRTVSAEEWNDRQHVAIDLNGDRFTYVPLLFQGERLGDLGAQPSSSRNYDEDDVHVLELLANHVAVALNGLRLTESLDALSRLGQTLACEPASGQIEWNTAEQVRRVMRADIVALYPFIEDAAVTALPVVAGLSLYPDERAALARAWSEIAAQVAAEDQCEFVSDVVEPVLVREAIASVAAIPLRIGATPGAFVINYRSRQSFSAIRRRLIHGASMVAATALGNAGANKTHIDRRQKELEVVRRIDAALARKPKLSDVLFTIVSGANEIVGAELAALILGDSSKQVLRVVTAIGHESQRHREWTQRIDDQVSITRWAFRHRETVRVDNVRTDPFWREHFVRWETATVSEMDVPLLDRDDVIGVLNFESPREQAFTREHQEFVQTLAGQVVVAIRKAQLYEAADKSSRDHESLVKFVNMVTGELDQEKILQRAVDIAERRILARSVLLLLRDATDSDALVVQALRGANDVPVGTTWKIAQGLIQSVLRHTRSFAGETDSATDADRQLIGDARSIVAATLRVGSNTSGLLIATSATPNAFDTSSARFLTGLATTTDIALQNAQRYRQLEEERRRLTALHSIAAKSGDPIEVRKAVVSYALTLTPSSRSDLDVFEHGQLIQTYYCDRKPDNEPPSVVFVDLRTDPRTLTRGIMAHVARTKKPHRTGNTLNDEHYLSTDPAIHSEMAIPLVTDEGELIGVLNVESREYHAFDENDEKLLSVLASEAVAAFQLAQSRARVRRELKRFLALLDVGRQLAELTADRGTACNIVSAAAADQCDCAAVVRIFDPATKEFVLVSASGATVPPFTRVPLFDPIKQAVYESNRTYVADDVQTNPEIRSRLSDPDMRSLMVAPVRFGDNFYGTVNMAHARPAHFADADQKLIEGLAGLLAVTLHRMDTVARQTALIEETREAEDIKSMGDAAFQLTHRLANDLGPIRSRVNTALAAQSRVELEEQLNLISTDIAGVLKLSKSLKHDVSTFRIGKPEVATIAELLADVECLEKHPLGIEIIRNFPNDIMPVMTRREHAISIIRNIVINAYEAMKQKGCITLHASNESRHVRLEFHDTGPGIPEKDWEKIFIAFYSTKESSGFGLWSARRRARLNGGDLFVAPSDPGAKFVYQIPRADVETQYASDKG